MTSWLFLAAGHCHIGFALHQEDKYVFENSEFILILVVEAITSTGLSLGGLGKGLYCVSSILSALSKCPRLSVGRGNRNACHWD